MFQTEGVRFQEEVIKIFKKTQEDIYKWQPLDTFFSLEDFNPSTKRTLRGHIMRLQSQQVVMDLASENNNPQEYPQEIFDSSESVYAIKDEKSVLLLSSFYNISEPQKTLYKLSIVNENSITNISHDQRILKTLKREIDYKVIKESLDDSFDDSPSS